MSASNLKYNSTDQHAVVGFALPKKVVPLIDQLAAEDFSTRSGWIRKTILKAVQREVAV